MEPRENFARPPRRDAACLAALAGLGFWLLRQRTFYGPDGRHILKMIGSGLELHDKHYLYVPLLRGAIDSLALLGLSRYEAGVALSMLGATLAVFVAHRAFARLGLSRVDGNLATLVFATAPALVFFATVVELHTPFLAAAGVAMRFAAQAAQRPNVARAAWLGVATGLATGLHATGHLLLLAAAPLVVWYERLPLRRWLALGAVASGAHALAFLGLVGGLWWAGHDVGFGGAAKQLVANPAAPRLAAIPLQVWRDWLLPYAPTSFAAMLAACVTGRIGAWFALAVVSYLGLTFVLMAPATENGAYLLPVLFPAAALVAARLSRRAIVSCVVVGSIIAVGWVKSHDSYAWAQEFVAGAREAAGTPRFVVFCGTHREFDAFPIHGPDVAWRELINEANLPKAAAPLAVQQFVEWLRQSEREGHVVLMTRTALDYLSRPVGPEPETGPLLRAGIERDCVLEPVQRRSFEGFRLQAR